MTSGDRIGRDPRRAPIACQRVASPTRNVNRSGFHAGSRASRYRCELHNADAPPGTAFQPSARPCNPRARPPVGDRSGYDASMSGTEIIFAVDESPEGGYEARALGHSIFTQADSLEDLRDMVRDAVSCHFEDDARPSVIRLHIVRDELLAS